ncbi:MAG: EamA family transporter [Firmicutes bacterium]|nr:EamA family transporter [Bacillota bacterium]
MNWILIMLLHSFFKGGRQIAKKKSMEKSTMPEVLIFYTLYSIVLIVLMTVLKIGGNIVDMSPAKIGSFTMLMVVAKSFIIFMAWVCELRSLQNLPVGIHGILDLARVVFCTILGVVFLKEKMGIAQLLGMLIVCAGILMLQRFSGNENSVEHEFKLKYAMLALVSCFLNSITSLMDKKLMSTGLSPASLQFWYVLFLTPFYLLFFTVKRVHVDFRSIRKNHWIFILALMFVLADR